MNVILDLDQTLIDTGGSSNMAGIHKFDLMINKTICPINVKIRDGVVELLKYLDKFCNFYVVTNGIQSYALEVMKIINKLSNVIYKIANINIPEENISGVDEKYLNTKERPLKTLKK